ncbi:MAG TPA: TIGR00300 family protein [Bacillota bacterium]|jgi:lysine-ketoglutarate reductase/saccharopine dehydrogenase-like protein (TIGR00300 family)
MNGFSEEITLEGHIIDSGILMKAFDVVMDLGGSFDLEDIRVGRKKDETSFARLRISAGTEEDLHQIMSALQAYGAGVVSNGDACAEAAPGDGVLPEHFYSTTNLPTQVRLNGHWVGVNGTEMDLVIVLAPGRGEARMVPMGEIKEGDPVVVGHGGIRVVPLERAREREVFSFMVGGASSERPKRLVIKDIAKQMKATRAKGGKILVVGGPAIIHTGAAPHFAKIIRAGYVQALFGGNAIATHDVEAALFGTSLGINLKNGQPVEGGHSHHMSAINVIRRVGSLRAAVDAGILREGVVFECLKSGVEMVLAGSVRDDGPLPDVIVDMGEAQRRMRAALHGVELTLMIATMLHSIATGNMLPASVKTVVVDINPAVVTKLVDRGTHQALGLVTDAELFLRELVEALGIS